MNGSRGRLGGMLLVALCLGSPAASPAAAGIRWGVSGGPLVSRFADAGGDPAGLSREPKLGWSGGLGVVAAAPLSDRFGLVAGLEYAEVSDLARVTNHSIQFVVDGRLLEMQALWKIRQHALVVPVLLEYRRGPLRVGAGPGLRFLFEASRTSSEFRMVDAGPAPAPAGAAQFAPAAQIFEEVGTFAGRGDATSFYERLTASALGSLGAAWPAGANEARAELRVSTDLGKASTELAGGERATTVQLRVSVLW